MIFLVPLHDKYTIYQLKDDEVIPKEIIASSFYSVTKTSEETSILTNCSTEYEFLQSSKGWTGLKVEGILEFSEVGIISDITKPLKENGISVFIVSTFNTDYIFVKEETFEKAIDVLNLTDNIRIKR